MTAEMIVDRLSDYLNREVDGHDILDFEDIVSDLSHYGIGKRGTRLTFGATSVTTVARPASAMRKEGLHDPKGPQLSDDVPDDMILIGGFELAHALVRLLTGQEPISSDDFGRGSGYRKDLEQLRAAGF
jgi:hypothetical protein